MEANAQNPDPLGELTVSKVGEMGWSPFNHMVDLLTPKESHRPQLFHYTDLNGLKGIVEGDLLHASHIKFLNDSTEFKHGKDLIEERLDALIPQNDDPTSHESLTRILLNSMVDQSIERVDAYVVCFCTKDDLLSQWRGYSQATTGYSLKFSSTKLYHRTDPRTFLAPVCYLEHQKRTRVDAFISGVMATLKRFDAQSMMQDRVALTALLNHLMAPLHQLMALLKHEAFKEECEWRLVHIPWYYPSGKPATVKIKIRGQRVVPYVELAATSKKSNPTRLPIGQIRVGPTENPELMKAGVYQVLRASSRSCQVTSSTTPLR